MSADNRIIYHEHNGRWYVWHGSCSADYHEPPSNSSNFSSENEALQYAYDEQDKCVVLEGGIEKLSDDEIIRALRADYAYYRRLSEAFRELAFDDEAVIKAIKDCHGLGYIYQQNDESNFTTKQGTGVLDTTGTEIYQGDMCEYMPGQKEYKIGLEKEVGSVCYSLGQFEFNKRSLKDFIDKSNMSFLKIIKRWQTNLLIF